MEGKQNNNNQNRSQRSNESKSQDGRKPNNRRRRYSAKNKTQGSNDQSSSSRNNKRRRPNNKRHHNRNKSGQNRPQSFLKRYDQLLEQHYRARKKYFEFYHRSGSKQLAKLERVFYQAIGDLRKFEEGLKPEQKAQLAERLRDYPLDHEYTEVKEIEKEGVMEVPLDFNEEPHYLESQKERTSYADDTEESSGSMEDYELYKKSLG